MSIIQTKLLYIAHDTELTRQANEALCQHGYLVTIIDSGVQALVRMREQRFDLAIIDICLTDMHGLDILKQIQLRSYANSSIILSDYSDQDLMLDALKQGADDFLAKDNAAVFLDLLPVCVEKVLAKHRLQIEKEKAEASKAKVESYYNSLIAHTDIVAWEYLLNESRFVYVSPQVEQLTGHTQEEWQQKDFLKKILAEDQFSNLVDKGFAQLAEQKEVAVEIQLPAKDGLSVQVKAIISIAESCENYGSIIKGGFINVMDAQQINEKQVLAEMVFDTVHEGIMITDVDNRIEIVNPAFTKITGYTAEEIRGKNPNILSSGLQDTEFYADMWQALNEKGHWEGELWNRNKMGKMYAETAFISKVFDEQGNVQRHIAVFGDVTERKKAEEKIYYQANYDTLTGLPNRQLFNERLHLTLATAKRNKSKLALLFIDLDHFKEVNDSAGHHTGDRLLIQVAKRLKVCVRDSDTLARLGGDEFTIILNNIDNNQHIECVADKILSLLEKPFVLPGNITAVVSASIGIAVYPNDGKNDADLIRHADTAMYGVKSSGKNGYQFFTAEMTEQASRRQLFKAGFRQGIENKEFKVFFQPIWHLQSAKVSSVEALIRWQHPELGLIAPDDFIPIAEESGFIHDLSLYVLEVAIQQIKRWDESGLNGLVVAINLSPIQFKRLDEWLAQMHAFLYEYKVEAHRIKLEITETALMGDMISVMETLSEIQSSGIEIALDDFGTGYSSLSRISGLPLNYIKIDRSFVSQISVDGRCNIIEAIISMAHGMNCKVIAEGIETKQQLNYLIKQGCDLGQGFLCSCPQQAEDLTDILKAAFVSFN